MQRKIIEIDKVKCNGCGLCANACHEGAIGIVNGKAELLRDDFCDGLGDCLPVCPTGAITFVERDAASYNEDAVRANKRKAVEECGCPGSSARSISRAPVNEPVEASAAAVATVSELQNWPVQLELAPLRAPYFDGADLLVAADCAAYARAGFHTEYMRGKITIIACPKQERVDYTEKLTEIISNNDIKSLTIVRMEVPCCGGIERAAVNALKNSGKFNPWQVVTLGISGEILKG